MTMSNPEHDPNAMVDDLDEPEEPSDLDEPDLTSMYLRGISNVGMDGDSADAVKKIGNPQMLSLLQRERLIARLKTSGFDVGQPIGKKRFNDNPDDWHLTQPPEEGSEPLSIT